MRASKKYLIIFLPLLLSGVASAEIYRWVDEKGKVHFGEIPPDDGAEKIIIKNNQPVGTEPTRDTRSTREKEKRFLDFLRQERIDREVAKAEEEQKRAELKKRCNTVALNYKDLEAGGRFYELDENGERVFLTDEQLEEERKEMKQFLDKTCPSF